MSSTISKITEILERGLVMFVFFLLVFSVGRIIFIAVLNDYMGDVELSEILTAIWIGLRLSCQTAGILTVIVLIPSIFSQALEKVTAAIVFAATSILYIASFPFYRQFHSNFNQIIFNAVNDDMYALTVTLIDEFRLPLRLLIALILAAILYKCFIHFKFRIPNLAFLIIMIYFAATLTVFSGGLNWQTELNFENIGVTKDKFLNEAILDNYHAIYRGYVLQNRIASSAGLNFTARNIKKLATLHTNKPPISDNLDDYLIHRTKGAIIPKPKHIFVIISESYANWTLLGKYSNLHITDGMKSIINAEDSDYCPTFLPNGANTVSAVTGIVAGLADANLYLTTLPQSFTNPYSTAAAPQMKRLGYTANFFYAGPATWERISDFTTAQGFDNFYSQGDISALEKVKGNVWGVDDKFLYRFIEHKLNFAEPSFNVILNTSNHSPYTVDLASEEINLSLLFDDDLNKKLAHQFYADRELKNFIDNIKSKAPESIFIIVGDHADRCNIDKQPSNYERFAVPFIITGNGIKHGILLESSAGSHIDIIPTIIELIAPEGFEYHSIGTSLTENTCGVNYAFFMTHTFMGNANVFPLQPEPLTSEIKMQPCDLIDLENYINFIRGASYWRVKFGSSLTDKK